MAVEVFGAHGLSGHCGEENNRLLAIAGNQSLVIQPATYSVVTMLTAVPVNVGRD
jgi:hypothetical protein